MMKVIIGCEESQIVCKAFRERGHEAYSCDILPCSGGHPEWHIQGDVLRYVKHDSWDMGIFFPPCTHLAVSGARHFAEKIQDGRQWEAIKFFMEIVFLKIEKKSIENPIGIMSRVYREPDQIIQPYYFGDEAQKTTCLWLFNLPPLYHNSELNLFDKKQTHVDKGEFHITKSGKKMPKWYVRAGWDKLTGKRSRTFPGIAKAMAEQWG